MLVSGAHQYFSFSLKPAQSWKNVWNIYRKFLTGCVSLAGFTWIRKDLSNSHHDFWCFARRLTRKSVIKVHPKASANIYSCYECRIYIKILFFILWFGTNPLSFSAKLTLVIEKRLKWNAAASVAIIKES